MKLAIYLKKFDIRLIGSIVVPILLFGVVLCLKIPYTYIRFFGNYTFVFFSLVVITYYCVYKSPERLMIFLGFGFTLMLCALTLSYRWSSGFSDNFIIGGLLPYKDAKNYYVGANLILNGLPLEGAGQGTERPLFPGVLSSILLITGKNLRVSLAVLTLLAGTGLYFSSLRISKSFGPISASLYSALLFFYIHSWLGYTMSELYGFIMGCFSFSLIWQVARDYKWIDLILGILTLMIAISARAGAFLVFPLLALWAGWIFRGKKRYSIKSGIYTFFIIIIGYFAVNFIFGRLIGVPGGSTFGNFAYAVYGQIRGGTGWHSAIEELGTRSPTVVYRAAFQFFLAHPFSLLIGIAKSYRDFFFPGHPNIFPFDVYGQPIWLTYTLWAAFMAALIWGLILLIKSLRLPVSSLLIAGFGGILFSIPFLPPVDGGSRFYASTMPFLYVIPAVGVSNFIKHNQTTILNTIESTEMRFGSSVLIVLTVILPVLISSFNTKSETEIMTCASNQEAFTININPSSYIDLVQDGTTNCGIAPDICLSDFMKNNSEFEVDDFYQEIHSMMWASGANIRLIPAINLPDKKFHYFYIDTTKFDVAASKILVSGCATEVLTRNQSIFVIESILPR